MTTSINASNGVTPINLSQYDLETALMMVQSQRANILEDQLKTQLDTIQQRNQDIAKLNDLIGKLKAARPSGTDPEAWGQLSKDDATGATTIYNDVRAAGLTMPTGGDEVNNSGNNGVYDAKQKTIDVWVEQLKGKIDSLNSSQQMDMLRMQSLTNKRNEAFDLMTNFIKKMADSRSSVLGNMR